MVRDWFYPEHVPRSSLDFVSSRAVDRRQDAVDLVSLWHFRDPKLTYAVVSTARLTDALLHDRPARREAVSDAALRSIYAMNFCRFVNSLVDRDVRKSATATIARVEVAVESDAAASGHLRGQSSMYANALAMGLPESFVELRHQAIHDNQMPSLEMLRLRTEEALEWLWGRWWKFNAEGSPEPALSMWEEKHGRWSIYRDHVAAEERGTGSKQQTLCPECRKRKWSSQEEDVDDEDGQNTNPEPEPENRSHDTDRFKQQKLETGEENQTPPPPQRHTWTIDFSGGGYPESGEGQRCV